MLTRFISQLWHPDVAIDLGTATTRVSLAREGYSYSMASVCGATPALSKGVIVNIEAAADVLRPALHRLRWLGITRPRALACAPSDTSLEEREAVIESCCRAGAAAAAVMPEPVAAAMGDGLEAGDLRAALVLDIGDGVTDCALIRAGRLEMATAVRVACADLRAAIKRCIALEYGLEISEQMAQHALEKTGLASLALDASGLPSLTFIPVEGMSLSRVKNQVNVPSGLLLEALNPVLARIIGVVRLMLAELPECERQMLAFRGIRLSGGGSLLPGMASRIAEATGVPVRRIRQPLGAVARGAKSLLPLAAREDLWRRAAILQTGATG